MRALLEPRDAGGPAPLRRDRDRGARQRRGPGHRRATPRRERLLQSRGRLRAPRGRDRRMRRAFVTVFLKELKDSLRDRRTALMVLVASILTGPVTLVLVAQFVSGLEEKAGTLKVRIVGKQHAPAFVNFLQRNDVEIEDAPADYEARVREGRLDAVIVVPEDFDARFIGGDTAKVEIVFDDSRAESGPAIRQAERPLRAFNRETGMLRMVARGVSPDLVQAVKVEHLNTATPRQKGAFLLFLIPMFAI